MRAGGRDSLDRLCLAGRASLDFTLFVAPDQNCSIFKDSEVFQKIRKIETMFIFKLFKSSLERLFIEEVEIGLEHLILFAAKCGICLTLQDVMMGSVKVTGLVHSLKEVKKIQDPVIIRALTETMCFIPPAGLAPQQRKNLSNLLNQEIQREISDLLNTSDYCSDLDETY